MSLSTVRSLNAMAALEAWRTVARPGGNTHRQITLLKQDLDILSASLDESAEIEETEIGDCRPQGFLPDTLIVRG